MVMATRRRKPLKGRTIEVLKRKQDNIHLRATTTGLPSLPTAGVGAGGEEGRGPRWKVEEARRGRGDGRLPGAGPPICFILPSLSHRVPSSCMCQAGNVGLLDAVLGVDAN
jgi:hypothetical protein